VSLSGPDAADYNLVYAGVADGFVVSAASFEVDVSGSQTYGSSSPSFTGGYSAPAGVTVTGTPSCTTVGASTAISPTLPVASYTILGSSCTGVSLSGPDAADYNLVYAGVADGFVVSEDSTNTALTVNPSSEPIGSESEATFTVTVTTTNGEELPETDSVTVQIGSLAAAGPGVASCLVQLTPQPGGGSGFCTLTDDPLPVGDYTATAVYGGDSDLSGSAAPGAPFTVTSVYP